MNITFRHATIQDHVLLEYWDTKEHVIACDPNSDWNWKLELKKAPSWREQFIAMLGEESIGMVQIIDPHLEETHYWGDVPTNLRAIDIWIGEEKNLNKGYGTQMMNLALQRCFAEPEVTAVLIDPLASNTKAHRFYKRIGFQFVEERNFDGEDCFVFEMKSGIWKNAAQD